MSLASGVVATPKPSPEPTPRDPVRKRTVLDRSDRVVRARIPTERVLRFASTGQDVGNVAAGPLVGVTRTTHELLLAWSGTIRVPTVMVDVAADLRAIRIVDRSPGCDLGAVGHRLVLQIRMRDWFDPGDIDITTVRRPPR